MELFFFLWGALSAVFYLFLIARYCYAWGKLKSPILENHTSVFVSIIVAARNEEKNITKLLDSLIEQSYPKNKFEIIIVDDSSTDATTDLIQTYIRNDDHIKLVYLTEKSSLRGKKEAINEGVKISRGELIVATDADCIMGNQWLSSLVSFYIQTNAKMIVAPVVFYEEKTIFEKMQSLEFAALITCSGASLYYNKAIMCNGANLAYTKKVFEEVNGFREINQKPTGDDVLLMYKIKEKYPNEIYFLKSRKVIAYTFAQKTVKDFFNQRKRWASKGFAALNSETKWVSTIVYSFNLFLFLFSIGLLNQYFHLHFIVIGLILFLIKSVIDFLLLFLALPFFEKRKLLIYFPLQQLINIVYVSVVGLLGFWGKYEWKGRKVN